MFPQTFKEFKMRLVQEEDASFILELRSDILLSKYLNPISKNLQDQKNWIKSYKAREQLGTEFYFVYESIEGEKFGLNRLYNMASDTFELGSWIFKRGIPANLAIKADLVARDYAFNKLGFKKCVFEVRKKNKSVIRYHKLFGAQIIREDDINYYFELHYQSYLFNKLKIFKRFNY